LIGAARQFGLIDPICHLHAAREDSEDLFIGGGNPPVPLRGVGKTNDLSGSQQRITFRCLESIALNPGHVGEDPGAIGARGSYEKSIVLYITKRLKSNIDQEASMRPILTREGDYFVPLHRRVFKIRRVEANLFILIYADTLIQPIKRIPQT